MKKIIYCFLSTLMLIFCTGTVFAESLAAEVPVVSIICDSTVNSEEAFDAYVNISEISNAGGGRITFGYDNTVLEIVSISAEPLLSGVFLQSNIAYTDSSARVSWAGVSDLSASGNILKLTFKAKSVYEDTKTAITINDIKLTSSCNYSVSVTAEHGEFTVKAKNLPEFSVDAADDILIGSSFDVNVNISENTFACGGRFNLVYDNTKLELVSTQTGEILSDATVLINPLYAENALRMNWADITGLTDGGSLLTVTFKALDNASGEAAFTLEGCKMTDSSDEAIQFVSADKTVQLVAELVCSTETEITEADGEWQFTTAIKNCPDSAVLIVALYSGNSLTDVKITDIGNIASADTYFDKCEFDTAKIMVWESPETSKPVSDIEKITYK